MRGFFTMEAHNTGEWEGVFGAQNYAAFVAGRTVTSAEMEEDGYTVGSDDSILDDGGVTAQEIKDDYKVVPRDPKPTEIEINIIIDFSTGIPPEEIIAEDFEIGALEFDAVAMDAFERLSVDYSYYPNADSFNHAQDDDVIGIDLSFTMIYGTKRVDFGIGLYIEMDFLTNGKPLSESIGIAVHADGGVNFTSSSKMSSPSLSVSAVHIDRAEGVGDISGLSAKQTGGISAPNVGIEISRSTDLNGPDSGPVAHSISLRLIPKKTAAIEGTYSVQKSVYYAGSLNEIVSGDLYG